MRWLGLDGRLLAPLTVALLLAGACGEGSPAARDEPVTPAPAEAQSEPATTRDDAESSEGTCALAPVATWLEGAPPRGTLAVALDAGEGLLVALSDAGALQVRAVRGGRASGSAQTHRLAGADALFALEPLGDGLLLVARGACAESAHCWIAQRLDARGTPVGERMAAALPSPLRTARRAATGERLYLAWSADDGHRGLDVFTLERGALGRTRRPLGDEPADGELPVEILGLAADADRWAIVWRRGAPEDARSEVHITTEDAQVEAEALHHALVLDAIALDGDHLAMVAGFEFSRPHALRFALGADEPADAREIEAGASVPAPFAERVRASLEVDADGLWLRRTNAAGDPIGAPTRVMAERAGAATVTRAGEDSFVVAWIAPDAGAVRAVTARCR